MTDWVREERAAGAASRPRGRLRVAMICLAAAIAAATGATALLAVRATDEPSPVVPDRATRFQHFDAEVSDWGISLSTDATFSDSVTLTHPMLRVGEVEVEGWLWLLDGRDHEGEDLDRLRLPTGTAVGINGLIRPRCDATGAEASISVQSENSTGKTSTNHFAPRNSDDLASAIRQFCDQGPTINAGMTRMSPEREAVIAVSVVNPGPADITIEVPAYSDEHVTWSAVRGTVPGGERATFEIHGTRVGCEPGEIASWQDGRLLVDGEPFIVRSDDAWC